MLTASGKQLHPIGIGTWDVASRIENVSQSPYGQVHAVRGNEATEIDGLRFSLQKGQNHIDCAELYGAFYTDEVVGQALAGTSIDRSDLFIADKLWKNSVAPGAVAATVAEMLRKLGTDYLDLLYIHAPWEDTNWQAGISQIDDLIDSGLVRHLGVSNFTVEQMQEAALLTRHGIAANQMHYSCLHRDEVDAKFMEYCASNDIAIVAYQPVKRGEALRNETIGEIAAAHNATHAQVAIAWLLQQNTLPIPKAIQPSHIEENLGAVDLKLTDDETNRLRSL